MADWSGQVETTRNWGFPRSFLSGWNIGSNQPLRDEEKDGEEMERVNVAESCQHHQLRAGVSGVPEWYPTIHARYGRMPSVNRPMRRLSP